MDSRPYYEPRANGVERVPTALQLFLTSPRLMRSAHWHAQVEVNYIVRGWAHYRMSGHEARFEQGDFALFWGGQPHWLDDASDDVESLEVLESPRLLALVAAESAGDVRSLECSSDEVDNSRSQASRKTKVSSRVDKGKGRYRRMPSI